MADPRIESYARLLVERCVDVQPGWQVLVAGTPLARPLLEEVARTIARRRAYALVQVRFTDFGSRGGIPWILEAPEELLAELPGVERHLAETIDALIGIVAPENTRDLSEVDQGRLALLQQAERPLRERIVSYEVKWVGCHFPTNALAQEAGMTLREFEQFLYGACLLDWDAEAERMRRIAERLTEAREVRITGRETDVTLSIEGREVKVDDGHVNMPGGEVYCCPLEDSAAGTVAFVEFPALYAGREVSGICLRFAAGRVVDASAAQGEDFLLDVLDTDDGARRLGELGIGCNPGITRHLKNVAFDEKIGGTVHLALGQSYTELGGTNESAIHWDIVKDLRDGGRIYVDGELAQENGKWLLTP
jgi:aminopeptidase